MAGNERNLTPEQQRRYLQIGLAVIAGASILLIAGIALIYPPAGLIVAGITLGLVGLAIVRGVAP